MAIENSVSNFFNVFVDSSNIFDCRLSDVKIEMSRCPRVHICATETRVQNQNVVLKFMFNFSYDDLPASNEIKL